jgi:hypothetical protein
MTGIAQEAAAASDGAFVGSQPHLAIMDRRDHYCDEATFVGATTI